MKKFLSLFSVVALLLSACACFPKPTEPDDPVGDLSAGEVANDVYTNGQLGVSFTLPDGWYFYEKDELAELSGLVGDVAKGELAEQMKSASVVYDMYASNEDKSSSANGIVEKISQKQSASFDARQALEAQFSTIKTSFSGMGFADTAIRYTAVTVGGKTFDGARLTATLQGVPFYETIIMIRRGNYVINFTLADYRNDNSAATLQNLTID